MSVMHANKFDISNVKLSTVKSLDNGGKMLFLNYGDGIAPIYIQTPELDIPFDPSYFADNDKSGKYQIKVSMKDMDNNKSLKEFHDKMCEFDQFLKDKAMENRVPWFKNAKMKMDTVESLYTHQVKVSVDAETGEPNGKYPPSFGFKVVKKDGKVLCKIYDNQKKVYDVNNETEDPISIENVLMKGSKVKAVLKCNGIWLANGKFGCTWRAEQIKVKVPEGGLQDFAILSDSDDEDEMHDTSTHNLIDDSDDDDSEEKVVTPTPPPSKKKKVTRKVNVKSSA